MGKKQGGGGRPGMSAPSQFGEAPWAQSQGAGGQGRQQQLQQMMQQFQQARQGQGGQGGGMGAAPNGNFDPQAMRAQAGAMRDRIQQGQQNMQGQLQGLQGGLPQDVQGQSPDVPFGQGNAGGPTPGSPRASAQANLGRAQQMMQYLGQKSKGMGGGQAPGQQQSSSSASSFQE